MSYSFDYKKAAAAIVEAEYFPVSEVAEEYDVSRKTIYRWRERVEEDPDLKRLVQEEKKAFAERWEDRINPILRSAIEFVEKATDELDPSDPQSLRAVTDAFSTLAEIRLTKDVLDTQGTHLSGQAAGGLYPVRNN